jgi:hypothetical protein
LELERLPLEKDIVETPGLSSEGGRVAHFAVLDNHSQVDGSTASITGSPGLAGASVGGMSVCAQALAVDEGLRKGINGLLLVEAEHLGDDSCASNLDKDDVTALI